MQGRRIFRVRLLLAYALMHLNRIQSLNAGSYPANGTIMELIDGSIDERAVHLHTKDFLLSPKFLLILVRQIYLARRYREAMRRKQTEPAQELIFVSKTQPVYLHIEDAASLSKTQITKTQLTGLKGPPNNRPISHSADLPSSLTDAGKVIESSSCFAR